MSLDDTRSTFERLAARDPLWTVLTAKGKKNNRWDPEDFFRTGEVEIRDMLDHLDRVGIIYPTGRALDFGCAVGRLTRALSSRFDHVVGVDIAQPFLDLAQDYNADKPNCSFVLNTRADLAQFADDSFCFIYSNITLQHTPPDTITAYVAEFVRVLKPDGVAVFQIPAAEAPFDGSVAWIARRFRWRVTAPLKRKWRKFRNKATMPFYSVPKEKVLDALKAAGASVLQAEDDQTAAKGWLSYRYIVSKPAL